MKKYVAVFVLLLMMLLGACEQRKEGTKEKEVRETVEEISIEGKKEKEVGETNEEISKEGKKEKEDEETNEEISKEGKKEKEVRETVEEISIEGKKEKEVGETNEEISKEGKKEKEDEETNEEISKEGKKEKEDGETIEEISIEGKKEIEVGETVNLKVVYDESKKPNLVWSVSDKKIIAVNGMMIEGLQEGDAEISVTDTFSGLSARIAIHVNPSITMILDWALNEVGTEGFDEIRLPKKHPFYDECEYEWESEDLNLFNPETGLLGLNEEDRIVSVTCRASYSKKTAEKTFDFTVLGYAAEDVIDAFMEQFPGNKIFHDTENLKTDYGDIYPGAVVMWKSGKPEIFSDDGILNNKLLYEEEVPLYITVKISEPNVLRKTERTVYAQPMSLGKKWELCEKIIKEKYIPEGELCKDTILPDYIPELDLHLEWFSGTGEKFDACFWAENPILFGETDVTVKVSDRERSQKNAMHLKTGSKQTNDIWEKTKIFTDTIGRSPLTTYKYFLVSWGCTERGYIPFCDNSKSEITENILPYTDGRVRTFAKKQSTEYIVVHDTGDPHKGANAAALNRYIGNLNKRETSNEYKSWHFTVGNDGIYQHVPLDEVAYHAGDGHRVYGETYVKPSGFECIGGGNHNGIGIESCIDEGSDYTLTMRKLAKLIAELLLKYNLGFDRIKQHRHFSGKNCPQVMIENDRWEELIYLIKLEYYVKSELKNVDFVWESLNPDIMDNTGRIIKEVPVGTTVRYKVKATYKGETKEYEYESVLTKRQNQA